MSEGTSCFLLGHQVEGGTSLHMSHKGGHGGTLTASKTHRHTVSHPHHAQRCGQTHDRTLGPEWRDDYSQTQCMSESFMLERPSVAEEHARKTQAANTWSDQSSAEQRGEEEGAPPCGPACSGAPPPCPGLGLSGARGTWQRERIKGLHPTLLSRNSVTLAIPCRSHHVSPSWG